jgi:hypothetical protein
VRPWIAVVGLGLVLAGCDALAPYHQGQTPDAGAVDAPTVDAPAVDAPAVDAPAVDASTVDAAVPDASVVPDGGGPDGALAWRLVYRNGFEAAEVLLDAGVSATYRAADGAITGALGHQSGISLALQASDGASTFVGFSLDLAAVSAVRARFFVNVDDLDFGASSLADLFHIRLLEDNTPWVITRTTFASGSPRLRLFIGDGSDELPTGVARALSGWNEIEVRAGIPSAPNTPDGWAEFWLRGTQRGQATALAFPFRDVLALEIGIARASGTLGEAIYLDDIEIWVQP